MKLFRFFLISLISFGFINTSSADTPISNNMYCGYYAYPMFYYPILNQSILKNTELDPYKHCPEMFCGEFEFHKDYNLESWENFFEHKIEKEALIKILYQTSIDDYINLFNGKQQADSFKNVEPSKQKAFYKYMILAKQSEDISSNSYSGSGWYQGENESTKDIKPELLNKFLHQISTIKDPFLKNRYGFQLIRLAHYLGKNELALSFFDQYLSKNKVSNYMYYRALEQRSGAAFNLDQNEKAAEGFVKVFAHLPDRRETCALSLRQIPWNSIDFHAFFNDNSKYLGAKTFYRVYYAHAPLISEMNKLAEKEPQSPYLRLLAVREADKIQEENLYLSKKYKPTQNNPSSKKKTLEGLLDLCEKQINNSKATDTDFWKLIKSITFIGLKNYPEAVNLMSKITDKSDYFDQAQRIKFSAKILQVKTVNRHQINQLFLTLKNNKILYSYEPVTALFFNHIGDLYDEDNNTIMASFTYWDFMTESFDQNISWENIQHKSFSFLFGLDKYHFIDDNIISKFKQILLQPHKTEFEQFIINLIDKDPDDYINELKGTYYLSHNQIDQAIDFFQRIKAPENFYKSQFRPQIFSGAIHEYFDRPFMPQSDQIHLKYIDLINQNGKAALKLNNDIHVENYNDNKLALSKTIKRLEEKAESNTKNAGDYYYMLGNVFYNMSQRGWFLNNLYYMSNNSRNTLLGNYYYQKERKDSQELTPTERIALDYFKKAEETAQNKETKAKAIFMQAKVNPCYILNRDKSTWKYSLELCDSHQALFQKLKKDYSDTQFEKDLIKECSWFRDY